MYFLFHCHFSFVINKTGNNFAILNWEILSFLNFHFFPKFCSGSYKLSSKKLVLQFKRPSRPLDYVMGGVPLANYKGLQIIGVGVRFILKLGSWIPNY